MTPELVSIPAGAVRGRSLVAGKWGLGDWIPAGTYEIVRRANGAFHALMPSGQAPNSHEGTYYYPLEPHPWN